MSERNVKRLEKIKQEKRSQYLKEAVKIFLEKGFHGTTIKDIAKATNTSVGNVYRYFTSKEHIFQVLIEELNQTMLNKLRSLNKGEMPTLPMIKQVIKEILTELIKNKDLTLIFFEEMGGISKDYNNLINQMQEAYIGEFEKIFILVFAFLNIKDMNPRITAIAWLGAFFHVVYWWARTNFEMNIDDFVTYIANFLLFGTITTSRKFPPVDQTVLKKFFDENPTLIS